MIKFVYPQRKDLIYCPHCRQGISFGSRIAKVMNAMSVTHYLALEEITVKSGLRKWIVVRLLKQLVDGGHIEQRKYFGYRRND